MISICIATYNRLESLKRCLNPIFNEFGDFPYEIIVADGGSTDGTVDYLKSLDNVKLIEQGELTGSVKAFNTSFKIAKGKYIAPLSDDEIIVPKVWKNACRLMDKKEKIGIVVPKVQDSSYINFHSVTMWIKKYWVLLPKSFIFRGSVLKEINYFDESFRTYFVDADSPLSVLKLGYTIIYSREVGVVHYRIKDEDLNLARATTHKKIKNNKEEEYFKKKWLYLQNKLDEYLSDSPIKRHKTLLFKRLCGIMYYSKWVKPFVKKNGVLSMNVYDWLLNQVIIFKDKDYDHMEDFCLAQKYPEEIISLLE